VASILELTWATGPQVMIKSSIAKRFHQAGCNLYKTNSLMGFQNIGYSSDASDRFQALPSMGQVSRFLTCGVSHPSRKDDFEGSGILDSPAFKSAHRCAYTFRVPESENDPEGGQFDRKVSYCEITCACGLSFVWDVSTHRKQNLHSLHDLYLT
jgi:hypothetical protein